MVSSGLENTATSCLTHTCMVHQVAVAEIRFLDDKKKNENNPLCN